MYLPLDANSMADPVMSTITAGGMAVAVIQWLKETKWLPFINEHSAGINRLVAAIAACISAIGLHWAFDASEGVLTITGLHWANIGHSAWDVFKSYVLQWLMYKGVIKGSSAPE